MLYASDFETTTDPNDCRVWAYGCSEIGNPTNFSFGNSIDGFMEHCEKSKTNDTHYFHNLKFDGLFILYWLGRKGFKHCTDKKDTKTKTFTTLISDTGVFYSIEIYFKKTGKKVNKVTILNSLNLLNMSVSKVAKDFGLPVQKQELDYDKFREVGHKLTEEEIYYLRCDVEIMSRALTIMFDKGLTKMTIGSNALAQYKEIVGRRAFSLAFPPPSYDADIRPSYKGGWTYLNRIFRGKTVAKGIVLDVNSLYPWVMYSKKLPVGEGIYYEGKYKKDNLYDLYIQRFTCSFQVKKNHLPTVQIKKTLDFIDTEYLESSRDIEGVMQEVTLCMTSVDLKLFFDHYEVYNPVWIDGYKFKSSDTMFKKYIDKWMKEKIEGKKEGNDSKKTIAKLMLNSLYGKLSLNPIVRSKIPVYLKSKDKIKFVKGDYETRQALYIPAGSFITAYAREKTIRSAQKVYHRFIYADTDSLHLEGTEIPEELEIDSTKLGAWDFEFEFDKGKYLRQKCYMEYGKDPKKDEEKYTKITCAGMPRACYGQVNFNNFKIGKTYTGKLRPKNVSGGIVLEETTFKIREKLNIGF